MSGTDSATDLSPQEVAELASRLEGDVLGGPLDRAMYSTDASFHQVLPRLAVCPRTIADVQQAVKFARSAGIPIAARGAGSGLAGECLTRGMVIDFSRHFTRIGAVDAVARTVQAEAGCVFATLNDALAAAGMLFGPDPSSGTRATIGGIIGNNATGAHSICYGYASDHLNWVDAVLADGSAVRFYSDGRAESDRPSALLAGLVAEVPRLLAEWADRIEAHWPKTARNRAGYGVRGALNPDGRANWCKLLAGSEGTLALITGAELTLNTAPKARALLQVNFDSLIAMARALPVIMATGPSGCELMDASLMRMAREVFGPHRRLPDVAASLIVEHDGESLAEIEPKLARTAQAVRALAGLVGEPLEIVDLDEQAEVWDIRKKAVPLLFLKRNAPQPVPFIEDIAVDIDRMADYLGGLEKLLAEEGAQVAYFAHAGHGELHVRPFLDLHSPADREKMVRIAKRTFELAMDCGGTVSGEHGCGLTRSGFLARQYGELYELFRLIKRAFDPAGLLNPGKIVTDQPIDAMMTGQLRYAHDVIDALAGETMLHWADGELVGEAEACNGCGECRSLVKTGSMCPIFRATRLEAASPRAKANLVRHILTGQLDGSTRLEEAYRQVADLCINCKSCVLECPSKVNIPKLMQEAKSYYVARKGLLRVEQTLAMGETMGLLGSRFGAVANAALKVPGSRWAMEKATGVDRRRPMPGFAFGSFVPKARRQVRHNGRAGQAELRVAYFVDLFANYHDHALGQAVLDVLSHNGVEVVIPPQKSAAMPPIDYGDLPAGRRVIEFNLRHLAPLAEQGVPIICSEPTAALCLKEEWRDVVDGDAGRHVAAATRELMDFLRDLHRQGRLKTDFQPMRLKLAYHAPCHLKALHVGTPGVDLVRLVPGVEVDVIKRGCCGIAGTFGFQKRNYALSMSAGERLLDALAASDAPYGMSECSTCKMQMEHGSGKITLHPVKVLAMAYGYRVRHLPAELRR